MTQQSEKQAPLTDNAVVKPSNDTQNQSLLQLMQKGTDFGELSYMTRNDKNSVTLKLGQLTTQ